MNEFLIAALIMIFCAAITLGIIMLSFLTVKKIDDEVDKKFFENQMLMLELIRRQTTNGSHEREDK